uniref:MARVEL domain containing 2 n=1 Tax=Varanus komodoensis TaxID=61221 RepID=A0A8D2KSH1_VARKO
SDFRLRSRPGHHGRSVHYDEVYVDSPSEEGTKRSFQEAEQIVNADPLPPPPLPLQPPFGPEFYPSDSEEPAEISDLKPVRKFIPDSWKNFFKGKKDEPEWRKPVSAISGGAECSPPSSPTLTPVRPAHTSPPSSYQDPYGGSGGSYNSHKEAEAILPQDSYGSLGRHTQTALTYSEKVEAFNLRYSYMKSWAGLLRILGVVELLLGAAVFACITAYIHKDNEWYNMYGYSQPYSYGIPTVCLKLWRHETARRHREFMEQQVCLTSLSLSSSLLLLLQGTQGGLQAISPKTLKPVEMKPELINGYIPAGHIPKPIVMPDYLAKYPAIRTNEERDRYKAVFNDQFSEYKELSAEVQAVLKKFDELDALMRKLPQHPGNTLEHERIANVLLQYKKKKNDPTFLEKKERCEYLKNKLSHIKQRIQEYDKVMNWNA